MKSKLFSLIIAKPVLS